MFVELCLDAKDKSVVVYCGEYQYIQKKNGDKIILLDDGKKVCSYLYLYGKSKADGIYTGYVIYSRRSEIVVSFDEPIDEIR